MLRVLKCCSVCTGNLDALTVIGKKIMGFELKGQNKIFQDKYCSIVHLIKKKKNLWRRFSGLNEGNVLHVVGCQVEDPSEKPH